MAVPALSIMITVAGLDALVDAQNGVTGAIEVTEVGITEADFVSAPTLTALPNELKRIDTISGVTTAENIIHMTASDSSADVYDMRGFGLYLSDGTLFGIYSQSDPVFRKVSAAVFLHAIDLLFGDAVAGNIVFGDATFLNPLATTETPGIAKLATAESAEAGAETDTIMTPALVAALIAAAMPVGIVVAWSGATNNVPDGWGLCDGQDGRPDWRNRFIVGAGDDYAAGATGGSDTHNHPAQVEGHALTVAEMPAHSHGNGVADDNAGNIFPYGTKTGPAGGNLNSEPGINATQGKSESIGGGQAHGHDFTIEESTTLPPYLAAAFIIKL